MSHADRAVISVPRPLHARLAKLKREREAELGRVVSFGEIIEQWRVRAEGLELLAAHTKAVQP